VGNVDHDAAHRRSNLRYCSSVIVKFTARTPLQSHGLGIVKRRSFSRPTACARRFGRRQRV